MTLANCQTDECSIPDCYCHHASRQVTAHNPATCDADNGGQCQACVDALTASRQDAPLVQLPLTHEPIVEGWIDDNGCSVSYHEFVRLASGLQARHVDGSICNDAEFGFLLKAKKQ